MDIRSRAFERQRACAVYSVTRTCGSPNTPRTLAAARKPGSEYPSDSRRRRCFDLAILQHAKIERIPNLKKALIHKLICRYNPLKSSTRLPEDPGENPYVGYDASGRRPFLYDGSMPEGIDPMERVVAVETAPGHHEAWSLALLRREGRIQSNDLFLTWEAGQASALDSRAIPAGRDVGGVVVQRQIDGILVDVPYHVTFAFAFHAFRGGSPIHGAKPAG